MSLDEIQILSEEQYSVLYNVCNQNDYKRETEEMSALLNNSRLRRLGYEILDIPVTQFIPLGKDEKEKLECTGYKQNWCWRFLLNFICLLGLGVPYLFIRWYPQYGAYIGLQKCSLDTADTVLIKGAGGFMSLSKVLITGGSEVHGVGHPLRFFLYQLRRIVWNSELRQFQLLRGLANDKNTFQYLLDNSDGLSLEDRQQRLALYGKNVVDVKVHSYWRLLIDEVLNPFYIFEVGSIIFWCLDDYVFYSICVIIFSASSIIASLFETRKQSETLREAMAEGNTDTMTAWRKDSDGEETTEVKSQDLVPGDVIVIPRYGCLMICDALLLSGNCIVNESVLTGESVPVTKTPPAYTDDVYEPNAMHMRHTLYHGTKVLQTRFYDNNKVLALVVRTGSETSKGQLVRSILYTKHFGFDLYEDSVKFLLLMFGIAFFGMAYSIYLYHQHGAELMALLLRSLDIITIVVPPALPAAMTAGIVYSQARLKPKNIFCTSPPTINVCGKIKLVCFDKTGTLTEEGLDVYGLMPSNGVKELNDEYLIKDFTILKPKNPVTQVLACCHSLTCIDNHLCGDPLDLSMFTAIDWELEEPGDDTTRFDMLAPTVVKPKGTGPKLTLEQMLSNMDTMSQNFEMPIEIGIVRQFAFSSNTQSMSVIARMLGARAFTVFTKGAPEKIISLCNPITVPSNITTVLAGYTSNGFRVIALAYKSMPRKFNWKQAQRVSRDEVERDLDFLGLLLMQNTLKPESAPVIRELKMAGIKCVMVTGDNLLTAVSVSRDCGLLNTDIPVILVTVDLSEHNPSIQLHKMSATPDKLDVYDPSIPLAIDGSNWSLLQKHLPELVPMVVCRVVVFARMSPQHKRELVEMLQNVDYIVAMVGDGANDCSALRAANVGVSLSQAEASIAAPFTSWNPNITCVLELIKEGRCALVTSFGLFKYMALYSLVQFMSVLFLYQRGVELSNMEFLYVDLVITTFLAMVMGKAGPAKRLNRHRPITSLVAAANVVPLLLHILLIAVIQKCALYYLSTMNWFIPVDPTSGGGGTVQSWENTTVFMTSCFQYFILACVFNKGKPHRQPLHTNWIFVGLITILTLFTIYLIIYPCDWISELFELMPRTSYDTFYRFHLLIFPIIHLLLAIVIENVIADSRTLKWIVQRVYRKKQPKNRYKLYEKSVEMEVTIHI